MSIGKIEQSNIRPDIDIDGVWEIVLRQRVALENYAHEVVEIKSMLYELSRSLQALSAKVGF